MRITELLQDATIELGVKVGSKEEAIDHLIDLMVKGITEGKARVSEALQGLAGDMSVMATANVVSPRTAATATGSNQINRTVVLNSNINNTFNGERAAQQRMAGAAKQSARDVTSELARGLAYAR